MPWGLPWWAWFLICCGMITLCLVCCLPLLAAPAAMAGGKKRTQSKASTDVETVSVYEVIDEPDAVVPLTATAAPIATAAVPMATPYPVTY